MKHNAQRKTLQGRMHQLFRAMGVDPVEDDWHDCEKEDALQEAILLGDCQAVVSLVAEGANLNHREATQGFTPLHRAAYEQNMSIVTILMECGADPKITNLAGQTPLELAQAQQDPPASQALLELLDPPQKEDKIPPKAAVRP